MKKARLNSTPIYLLLLSLLGSCSWTVENFFKEDPDQVIESRAGVTEFAIIFTGNVNGETHPCGCRSFPLGGLPQVAGALARERVQHPIIFLDSGDTLFPQATLPPSVIRSHLYTAETLIKAMDLLGLNYWLPGDQDLGLGLQYLQDQLRPVKFQILAANLKASSGLNYRRLSRIQVAGQWIYLTGLISPEVVSPEIRPHLENPEASLSTIVSEMEESGYNPNKDYFLVMSHMGMDFDRLLAQKFPQIDWILGAHTQSFTNHEVEEGKTKLVQVLAKNHYLGKIVFQLGKKSPGEFSLIEVRDELKDQINPNPLTSFLDQYKSQVDQIRAEESAALTTDQSIQNSSNAQLKTYRDCMGCHQSQHDFWSSTSHALALTTLWQAKQSNNPQCIGCHVLGFQDPKGFKHPDDFAVLEDAGQKTKYLAQVKKAFLPSSASDTATATPSLRAQSAKQRSKLFARWSKLDEQFKISANFAGVQCLHCHQQDPNHPFNPETGTQSEKKLSLRGRFQSQCVKCHTPDRSPEWYAQGDRSTQEQLKADFVEKKIKAVSCPKFN